ncbi:UNVERIFIED_CONTAM: putative mitochondrial-processing peptidase subunit beta, mitochondrial [Sesamum radiatum]|uniref:Mitochondrial-processing peptidase subunit beta, mitochondrial n=1 Tax=Sesamum radiatum TaxID=300843 RepID=A0AAW2VPR7_SESRA
MTIRQLINLGRRTRKPIRPFTSVQPLSTAVATAPEASLPSPPPPTAMIYDRLAESVKEKLKKLEDPDPRFLKYNSPHPQYILTLKSSPLHLPESPLSPMASESPPSRLSPRQPPPLVFSLTLDRGLRVMNPMAQHIFWSI